MVNPLVVKKAPIIDGDLSDSKWDENVILNEFSDIQGDLPLQNTQVAVSMNKAKNTLYVVGKVEASPEFSNSGVTNKDSRDIIRDENIKIHIAAGKKVYTYIVNPKGALMDTRDMTILRNRNANTWNSTATSASRSNESGWQFEVEIPLDELNIRNQKTTINFSRRDKQNDIESEYALTFGKSRLDHRVPMYQSDWNAVDRFAELVLK